MLNASAYDAAEKPPPRPTAPPMDSPMHRQGGVSATTSYPPQPQREPSSSYLYAAPPQATGTHQQPSMPPMAPMPPMPPMPPMVAPQHSGYFQQAPAQGPPPPKYDAQYLPPPPPPPQVYADDDYAQEDDSSFHAFLKETGRLALFHGLNGLLGYVAFSVCVGGVATSVGLLPLCCFGVVVFRVLLYAVYGLAQLDVMLYNFITPPEDHVYVQVPPNASGPAISGERLAPTLAAFSPLSLMALIYFCSVKFVLSTLSSVCVSLTVTAPLSLVFAVLGLGHGPVFSVQLGPEDIADFHSEPLLFLLATACLFVIGVALMHLVARASREATRFFCCEQFSTYRYLHHPSQNHLLYPPMAATGQQQMPHVPQAQAYAYGAMDPYAQPANGGQHSASGIGDGSGGAVTIRFNAGGT